MIANNNERPNDVSSTQKNFDTEAADCLWPLTF